MNSLLQSLSGSPLFMEYARKLWVNLSLLASDNDSILIFRLLDLLMDLSKGKTNIMPSDFYNSMCEEFTRLNEE